MLMDADLVCQDHVSDARRKKSAAIANKIRGLKAERNPANGGAKELGLDS